MNNEQSQISDEKSRFGYQIKLKYNILLCNKITRMVKTKTFLFRH